MMLLALVCIATSPAPLDEWYSISLAGSPAGWSHVVESIEGDVRTVYSDETMTIGRANVEVTVRASTAWTDHLDGRFRCSVCKKWVALQFAHHGGSRVI
ncbi:MAG: hypothetical protein HOO04_07805, partial [Phycisphaerae bacterium]|nr:hypothetical protein [Phycisphaerae bacterium]